MKNKIIIISEFDMPQRGLRSCAVSGKIPLTGYTHFEIDGNVFEPVTVYGTDTGIAFAYSGVESFVGKEVSFI